MSKKKPIKSPIQPKRDLTKERDERCIPIAREMLKRIAAREDLPLGNHGKSEEEIVNYYGDLYMEEIAFLLHKADVRVEEDINYIFQLAFEPLTQIQTRTTMTINARYRQAVSNFFGVKNAEDVTINHILRALQASVDNNASESKDDTVQ